MQQFIIVYSTSRCCIQNTSVLQYLIVIRGGGGSSIIRLDHIYPLIYIKCTCQIWKQSDEPFELKSNI